ARPLTWLGLFSAPVLAGFVLILTVAAPSGPAAPSENVGPGKSAHGDAFNEGPRQAAPLLEGTGRDSFPVTTKSREAQAVFNQGVGQLHGHWYFEAERSFRQAAALDPGCAMAYWGMAVANFNNEKRAREFIKEAVKRKKEVSAREAEWIQALSDYFTSATAD